MRVRGFPSRVDTTMTGLELADPKAGWSWQAEQFQVLSLSYQPNHVIAVLPGEQVFATPYDTLRATSERLRGSVIFKPTPRLELDHMTFEIGDMRIASDQRLDRADRQGDSRDPAGGGRHGLRARPLDQRRAPGAAGGRDRRPRRQERAAGGDRLGRVDATLGFDKPWDRPALESGNPALQQVGSRDVSLSWGKLDLHGKGHARRRRGGLRRGQAGPEGAQLAGDDRRRGGGGARPGGCRRGAGGAGLMARFSGGGDTISVPLDFADGVARLGPIVLGPAPHLAQRG